VAVLRRRWFALGVALVMAIGTAPTAAQTPTGAPAEDDEVVVYGRALEQIGIAISGSQGTIGYQDIAARPLLRAGELVETVPGVVATQHSGTGKANQYFLRGFNLDHGTDFAGFVDGVPVNLRSHGHGQGYLDFNFLIPELIERVDYRKGPYFADVGDFSAAGTVAFTTYDRLARPLAEITVGEFGYRRAVAAGSTSAGVGDLLIGLEATTTNGPWVLDENLSRAAGVVKYSASGWRLTLNGYRAGWDATDQLPRRAVRSRLIDRFGFIDPDLGGETSRLSVAATGDLGGVRLDAYAVSYRLRLTSNFTYFLDDPVNGDEFQQRDRRTLFGSKVRYQTDRRLSGLPTKLRLGADLRHDDIGTVGLYRSVGGRRAATVREDSVGETSLGTFVEAEIAISADWRAVLGLRADVFRYDVEADLAANRGDGSEAILSSKLALAWRPADAIEFYANYGESFHSNDARGATISVDPATGAAADPVELLVRARGAELGMRVEYRRLNLALAGFRLDLGSELVFVGDAGTTEPNPPSRRHGAELSMFWRPVDRVAFDLAAAYTDARFRAVGRDDAVPNSVDTVVAAGATIDWGGVSTTLRVRHFGPSPLVEDRSARSDGTTLVNLGAYYSRGPLRLGLDIYNLLDADDADITYFYASRLPGEPDAGVEDVHFHPVEPRQLRASVRLQF
jgi:hypothetical protein